MKVKESSRGSMTRSTNVETERSNIADDVTDALASRIRADARIGNTAPELHFEGSTRLVASDAATRRLQGKREDGAVPPSVETCVAATDRKPAAPASRMTTPSFSCKARRVPTSSLRSEASSGCVA